MRIHKKTPKNSSILEKDYMQEISKQTRLGKLHLIHSEESPFRDVQSQELRPVESWGCSAYSVKKLVRFSSPISETNNRNVPSKFGTDFFLRTRLGFHGMSLVSVIAGCLLTPTDIFKTNGLSPLATEYFRPTTGIHLCITAGLSVKRREVKNYMHVKVFLHEYHRWYETHCAITFQFKNKMWRACWLLNATLLHTRIWQRFYTIRLLKKSTFVKNSDEFVIVQSRHRRKHIKFCSSARVYCDRKFRQ